MFFSAKKIHLDLFFITIIRLLIELIRIMTVYPIPFLIKKR